MFQNKKSILFITKSKITVSNVTIGDNPTEKIIGQFDWTPSTLDNVLLRIKRISNDIVRILLSEEFVYVVNVSLPSNLIVTKDVVRQKAQQLIPENLKETVWDFKEIANPLPYSSKQPIIPIQVVAVVKTLFETLSKSIANAELRVEAIEPLSYALARYTKKQNQSFLFVYIYRIAGETLLTLAQNETVLTTQRINTLTPTNINQFIAFVKETFLVEPKNIVFCGNTKNIDLKQYENPNFKVEIQNINPAISLAYKEDIKGKDEDVLNLQLLKVFQKNTKIQDLPKQVSSNASKKYTKAPTSNHFPKIIIVIIFLIMLGGIGAILMYNKNILPKNKPTPTPTPIQVLSPTPLITPITEIYLSKYTITILNGTGREGEATKLEALLIDNGFNVVKTGNADNFNYEKTQLRFKEKVQDEAKLPLDKLIKTLYDFSVGTKLEDEYESDILIIVGKSIKE